MTATNTDLIPNLQRNARVAFAPLQREFNRVFDELTDGWNGMTEAHFAPRMDIVDTKAGLEITLEAPGVTRDQIKIHAEDDKLTISGEKTASKAKTEGAIHLTERSYGTFSRSLYLPRSVDASRITAQMDDGVLKIVVPRRPGVEPRTIEIQAK